MRQHLDTELVELLELGNVTRIYPQYDSDELFEVIESLDDSDFTDRYIVGIDGIGWYVGFANPNDALIFKLRLP